MAAVRARSQIIKLYKPQTLSSSIQRNFNSTSPKASSDPVTHTGQQWEENDYRMVRFVDKAKKVNTQWAIKLIQEVPPTETKSRVIWCDGGGGPIGHPKVYINLDKPGDHSCNYCGLRFEKKNHH